VLDDDGVVSDAVPSFNSLCRPQPNSAIQIVDWSHDMRMRTMMAGQMV